MATELTQQGFPFDAGLGGRLPCSSFGQCVEPNAIYKIKECNPHLLAWPSSLAKATPWTGAEAQATQASLWVRCRESRCCHFAPWPRSCGPAGRTKTCTRSTQAPRCGRKPLGTTADVQVRARTKRENELQPVALAPPRPAPPPRPRPPSLSRETLHCESLDGRLDALLRCTSIVPGAGQSAVAAAGRAPAVHGLCRRAERYWL